MQVTVKPFREEIFSAPEQSWYTVVMVAIGKARHGRKPSPNPSKLYQATIKTYNRAVVDIPWHYEALNKYRCRKRLITLIQLIETRALPHAGETKFYTARMARLIQCSIRTVYNYLKILQKHGYISILTDNRINQKGFFYSIRVIRANRLARVRNYVQQRGKIFKVDIRPQGRRDGVLPETPYEYEFCSLTPRSTWDLAKEGKYDITIESRYRELRELADMGDWGALEIIGTKFKIDNEGAAYR